MRDDVAELIGEIETRARSHNRTPGPTYPAGMAIASAILHASAELTDAIHELTAIVASVADAVEEGARLEAELLAGDADDSCTEQERD